ncbi:hypothetical protein LIER_44003 [Lithospermum erythrorhizon]|uniref:Uncharacterized protein n=1 Tax=Lithospermum erythrorhizon TaxID=34254 RepID=A0AAV3RI75_LITER
MWVRWIATYRPKGMSFWVVEAKSTDSWGWKQMLHNRAGVRRFLSNIVGNGKCTNFLYDSWHRMGVLADHFVGNGRGLIRVPNNTSVADAYVGRWPSGKRLTEGVHLFLQFLSQLIGENDRVIWNDCGSEVKAANIWRCLSP